MTHTYTTSGAQASLHAIRKPATVEHQPKRERERERERKREKEREQSNDTIIKIKHSKIHIFVHIIFCVKLLTVPVPCGTAAIVLQCNSVTSTLITNVTLLHCYTCKEITHIRHIIIFLWQLLETVSIHQHQFLQKHHRDKNQHTNNKMAKLGPKDDQQSHIKSAFTNKALKLNFTVAACGLQKKKRKKKKGYI